MHADDANGVIIKYEVCYQRGSSVPDCSTSKMIIDADDTMTDITGLKPATLYTVAVRAFTAVGPGPLGERKNTTTAAATSTAGAREYITAFFHFCPTNQHLFRNVSHP